MMNISGTVQVSQHAAVGNVVAAVRPPNDGQISVNEVVQTTQATISSDGQALSTTDLQNEANSTLGPVIDLRMKSDDQQAVDYNETNINHYIQPTFSMDTALTSLKTDIAKLQSKIETARPNMIGKKWDFILKDGRIAVTGENLNAKDKQWLENTLNGNKQIVSAVKNVYASVVKFYENTEDNPYATMSTRYNGNPVLYVTDVEKQINGKIPIRELMAKTSALHPHDPEPSKTPYLYAIKVSQDYLQGSRMPKFAYSNYDLSDPGTAAYLKTHPHEINLAICRPQCATSGLFYLVSCDDLNCQEMVVRDETVQCGLAASCRNSFCITSLEPNYAT